MYVTKPLSHYIKYPDALSTPPEGPNSGYLVLQDEESKTYCCFGLLRNRDLMDLPFPQNKNLTTRYSTQSGENTHVSYNDVFFIPVLNQPLSSNRYYVIQPHGSHKGEAFTSSKEEDMGTFCFCRCIKDAKPRPLNPQDMYQQFEISAYEAACSGKGTFYAKSLASDGFPPYFLRRKGWSIYTKTPKNYELDEAPGINKSLRARLPEFNNISLSCKSSEEVVVGKWYCPFMFVKEGKLRDQMKQSVFYQMTLEQRWEQIFLCENEHDRGKVLSVEKREVVFVDGREATWDEKRVVDGAICFTSFDETGKQTSVGLGLEIVQRMKWEEERVGWIGGEEREVSVKKEDKFQVGKWKKFGFYALVERFVLKRMDGSLVMTCDFIHTHQIKTRWERDHLKLN